MSSNSTPPKIAIILLAAGSSSRMGSPKQLLKWGNTTLLNHSIEQAVASNANAVFVVLGNKYERIKNSIQNQAVTILKNKNWSLGLGSSIAFGVSQIQNQHFDGVLLMLADQPQVDRLFLNQLITAFQENKQAIIATSYKREAGVPSIFDALYFEQLVTLAKDKGGKALINNNLADTLLITPPSPISDIDTVGAYQRLYQHFFN